MSSMSAIYDPLSRIDAPPSRHAIESDSEDSDVDTESGVLEAASEYRGKFSVEPESLQQEARDKPLIILVGQAGEGFAIFSQWAEMGKIMWKGQQQGSVSFLSGVTVCLLYPSSVLLYCLEELHEAVQGLVLAWQPSSLILVSSYQVGLYLDSNDYSRRNDRENEVSPVRYLVSNPTSPHASSLPQPPLFALYTTPNYLTGAEACILTSSSYLNLPSLALLVPSNTPMARPHAHTRLQRRRRRNIRKAAASPPDGAEPEFPSDDEELSGPSRLEELDPSPLNIRDLPFAVSDALSAVIQSWSGGAIRTENLFQTPSRAQRESGIAMADFLRQRRAKAVNSANARNASTGMYA